MTTRARPGNDGPRDGTHPTEGAAAPEQEPVDPQSTGDEPMTGPQRSYLQTLAREAGEDLPEPELSKAAASQLIERLQHATGRIPVERSR